MKNTNQLCQRLARSGFIMAVTAVAWLPGHALAQAKGAQLLMTHVTTPSQVDSLKSGDAVAMVCAKCKSVMVHNVTTEKGHIQVMTVGSKHLCPGCNSTITTVGTGKGAKQEVKHICKMCGDKSVFCCATKPDSAATPGMDIKK